MTRELVISCSSVSILAVVAKLSPVKYKNVANTVSASSACFPNLSFDDLYILKLTISDEYDKKPAFECEFNRCSISIRELRISRKVPKAVNAIARTSTRVKQREAALMNVVRFAARIVYRTKRRMRIKASRA